ncbi:MFS transporter [Rothia sp. CCM 9418]|uniref:MFS transporter n=1 Tax=Rothia sp. CCM 9418 TaxID=3402661 RepID=UPI003ADCB1A6
MNNTHPHSPEPWNGYSKGSREYIYMLIAMFCAGIATFAQLYAPQAILPSIATDLNITPSSAALTISAATLGLALFAMVWAYIADIHGKSKAMFIAISIATVLGLISPWVHDFTILLTLRFAEGAALAGIAGVAIAFITEETNPLHAATASGLYIAGNTLGGLAGRLFAGPLTQWTGDWRIAITAVSLLGAITALIFIISLPKARRFTPIPRKGSFSNTLKQAKKHLKNPAMLALYLYAFTMMGTFVTIYNYVGFLLKAPPYLFSEIALSALFLSYLLGTISSSISARFSTRWGNLNVMIGSTALLILGIALTMITNVTAIIIGVLLLTFGFFCGHSIASGWTGLRATTGKAQATALYNLAYYAGSAVIGWGSGLIYNTSGWYSTAWFCIIFTALLVSLCVMVLTRNDKPHNDAPVA